jgi:hypothetical protein
MADTFTPLLRAILQEQGGNINLWGTIFNSGVTELLEQALAGVSEIDVTVDDVDLTAQNGLSDSARPMFLLVTGDPGGVRTITVPTLSKLYFVMNNTSPAAELIIKTALSPEFRLLAVDSPAVIFVDAVNNRIRTIGRAGAAVGPSNWTTLNVTFANATGGDTSINCRYATQGHLVFFEIPGFTVTTSTGTLIFTGTPIPAAIRPGTTIGVGGVAMVAYPAWVEGGAANVEWAFFAQSNGISGFTNIGSASPSAPDTYTLPFRVCFVWSTRAP